MLFSEQVRLLEDEEVLVDDTNTYTETVTKNISLDKQKLVYLKIKAYDRYGVKVSLDDIPIFSTGYISDNATVEKDIIMIVDAGSHTFKFEPDYSQIQLIHIATFNFPDKSKVTHDTGGYISAPKSQMTTVLNIDFTTPNARRLVAGTIKKYTVIVNVYVETQYEPDAYLKNPDESDSSGFMNWRLYLDDEEVGWDVRNQNNERWPVGLFGKKFLRLDSGKTFNVKVKVNNLSGYNRNVKASIHIVVCPWFFVTDEDHEPLKLDFPQGSTLYVTLEPLLENPTKTVKIGRKRFKDFGDSANYYYMVSGTDILNAYYTFEMVEPEKAQLFIKGKNSCISIIGVDIR
ncbi:hypothetical protein CW703_06915 [Candidatus Bathyarchaeota archaeon]|nr:MAG: hypothetical protein CW703_06915 [Candidatus Bathyarchaeota archaeon]